MPDEVVGRIPPDLAACTVEEVAINALGQGNRTNATIGRALNLIVRDTHGHGAQRVDAPS